MCECAIFLDRDGTLVEARHYPSRPEELCLVPDVGPELLVLQEAGFHLVVVTNQSGIAHGYFTDADLTRMHEHLKEQLAAQSVHLDAMYHCPHHVEGVIAELAVSCRCRKPQPGMLLQAADDFQFDLSRSWLIGDILDDIEAGNRAGCRTILVDVGTEWLPHQALRTPDFVAPTTAHALRLIRDLENLGPRVEHDYLPSKWAVESIGGGRG